MADGRTTRAEGYSEFRVNRLRAIPLARDTGRLTITAQKAQTDMARCRFAITTEGEVALSSAIAKTILQLASAANHPCALYDISVSFDGTSPSAEPVFIELRVQTTGGTMSAATAVQKAGPSVTVQATGQRNATLEPTQGNRYKNWEVHPQSGLERALTRDDDINIGGASIARVGLVVTAPANVNCVGEMAWEE